jgi:hypothetical protein
MNQNTYPKRVLTVKIHHVEKWYRFHFINLVCDRPPLFNLLNGRQAILIIVKIDTSNFKLASK